MILPFNKYAQTNDQLLTINPYIEGLMQEKRNPIANALELCLSSICWISIRKGNDNLYLRVTSLLDTDTSQVVERQEHPHFIQ